MGTRNLIAVVVDDEFKVAQYGQWDGYPSGQGAEVAKFICDEMDIDAFRAAVRECSWISTEEHQEMWTKCGAKPDDEFVNMEVSDRFKEKYPHLSRDAGAEILGFIQKDGARKVKDSRDFAGDSLFCEWAYVVDLDKEALEVYQGFNKGVPVGRFAELKPSDSNEYNPVSLLTTIPFTELTVEAMSSLEEVLSMQEEEEI